MPTAADLVKRLLVGRALRSTQLHEQLLPKRVALPIFASDPLSSVAYAPQELLMMLAVAGVSFYRYGPWIALLVAFVMFVVVASYRQNVHAYPSGGGDYEVAMTNLGRHAGLTVAAALQVDYVLTVAVSVSSGVENIGSAIPWIGQNKVVVALAIILLLTVMNLRGVRESGMIFAIPTYAFVVGVLGMIAFGLFRLGVLGDTLRAPTADLEIRTEHTELAGLALIFLLPAQRRLKAAVIEEQLSRLAGIERSVVVEEIPMPADGVLTPPGLGWRTRVQFSVRADGAVGLRRHRSHDIEPVDACLIAHPGVEEMGIERKRWPGAAGVDAVVSAATGDRVVLLPERRGRGRRTAKTPRLDVPVRLVRGRPEPGRSLPYVREQVAGRLWQVSGGGFWQVHPGAAQVLADAVLAGLRPKPGEVALDLYCGAGLFAGVLGRAIGPDGLVVGVESDGQAVRDARFNLRDMPHVSVEHGDVEQILGEIEFGSAEGGRIDRADLVVLDPPRTGAGRAIVDRIAGLAGRAVAYVSCDPATFARDLAYFGERGWTLETLRGFDAFPMTHHMEILAVLVRG